MNPVSKELVLCDAQLADLEERRTCASGLALLILTFQIATLMRRRRRLELAEQGEGVSKDARAQGGERG